MAENTKGGLSDTMTIDKSSPLYNLPLHVLEQAKGELSLVDCVMSSNADGRSSVTNLDNVKLRYGETEDGGCLVTSKRLDTRKTKIYRDRRNFKHAMIADAFTFLKNPKLEIGHIEFRDWGKRAFRQFIDKHVDKFVDKTAIFLSVKFTGTYEPIQNIGSGAFGIVCEAVETSSDYKVAIKKVAHASATPTLARRTLREIRVLRYIDPPNIVALRDIFRTKGPLGIDVFLVMDLMQNNLHHAIYGNEEPLEEYYITRFLGQLLRGLEYLHVASIAHRDLKPSNLLVNQDGTLRIADFGMAKFTDNSSKKHDDEGQIKMLLTMLGLPTQHVIDEIRCDRTRKLIQEYGRKADAEWDDNLYCKARGEAQIVRGHCDTVDFVKQLFQYDATDRISIQEALAHPYIRRVIEPMGSQKKCPFRVKRDMMLVEEKGHKELIKIMEQDVRSAENTYNEMHSGTARWMAGCFEQERKMELASGEYEMRSSPPRTYSNGTPSPSYTNGFDRQQQFGQPVSGHQWRIPAYGAA